MNRIVSKFLSSFVIFSFSSFCIVSASDYKTSKDFLKSSLIFDKKRLSNSKKLDSSMTVKSSSKKEKMRKNVFLNLQNLKNNNIKDPSENINKPKSVKKIENIENVDDGSVFVKSDMYDVFLISFICVNFYRYLKYKRAIKAANKVSTGKELADNLVKKEKDVQDKKDSLVVGNMEFKNKETDKVPSDDLGDNLAKKKRNVQDEKDNLVVGNMEFKNKETDKVPSDDLGDNLAKKERNVQDEKDDPAVSNTENKNKEIEVTGKEFFDEQKEKVEDEVPNEVGSEKNDSDSTNCVDDSGKVDNMPLDSDLPKEKHTDFSKEEEMTVFFTILDILRSILIVFFTFEIFGRVLFWLKTKDATKVYKMKNYDQIPIGGFEGFRYEKEMGYYFGVTVTLSRAKDIKDYLLEFDNGILNRLFWKPFFGFFGVCRNTENESKVSIMKSGILEANAAPSILE